MNSIGIATPTHPNTDCEALLMAARRYHADSRGQHTASAISGLRNFRRNTLGVLLADSSGQAVSASSERASRRDIQKIAARIQGIEVQHAKREANEKQLVIAGLYLKGWDKIREFEDDLRRLLEYVDAPTKEQAIRLRHFQRLGLSALAGTLTPDLLILSGILQSPEIMQAAIYSALVFLIQDPLALVNHKFIEPQIKTDLVSPLAGLQSGWRFDSMNHQLNRDVVEAIWNREDSSAAISNLELVDSHGPVWQGMARLNALRLGGSTLFFEFNHAHDKVWVGIDRLLMINPETLEPELTVVVRSHVGKPQFSSANEDNPASLTELKPALQEVTTQ
jgi:hypothetical protein